jgi:hypothetical protein
MINTSCLGSIVGIYVHINNKRLTDWDGVLTLGNVLSKFASATIIVLATESLGQLKWNWFNDSSRAPWD